MAVAESETDTPGTPPLRGSPGEETKPTRDERSCPCLWGRPCLYVAQIEARVPSADWRHSAVAALTSRGVPLGEIRRLVPLQIRGTVS